MKAAPRECPCHSKHRYVECCAPYHREEREPETPERLMRSRYAAFSLGLTKYLVKTLASSHEYRALPPDVLERELARAKHEQRYLDLRILHTSESADGGEVLFFAKIFSKGTDRSFVELSHFVKEKGALRYASGLLVPRSAVQGDPQTLDRETFLKLAETHS